MPRSAARPSRSWTDRRTPPSARPFSGGHALDAGNQVVLGAATLAALHKKAGGTVVVSTEARKPGAANRAQAVARTGAPGLLR
jgi:hypothetical protein